MSEYYSTGQNLFRMLPNWVKTMLSNSELDISFVRYHQEL